MSKISSSEPRYGVIFGSCTVDALLKPTTGLAQGKFNARSYASVVGRRKDGDSLNLCNFENELLTVSDNLSPGMSTLGKNQVSKREVGVQVDLPVQGKGTTGVKNQWTTTNRRGLYKNKCVTAKICCTNEDKVTAHPPVQFLGDQFNFENAVANSVSQLGIKFLDADDEAVPILPKGCEPSSSN